MDRPLRRDLDAGAATGPAEGAAPRLRLAGGTATRLWGLTTEARALRMAAAEGFDPDAPGQGGSAIVVNLGFVFDPVWLGWIRGRPGTLVTCDGAPVLAHAPDRAAADRAAAAMTAGGPVPEGVSVVPHDAVRIANPRLRKTGPAYMLPLTPATRRRAEELSYAGAYKGVTDLLTKYLWAGLALQLVRLAAWARLPPNAVTLTGFLFCAAAGLLFAAGAYWLGVLCGFVFMVLDTVDGKLARCTLTSSSLGHVLDHGVDLVHPPIWWWAWARGLDAAPDGGLPFSGGPADLALWVILGGYVAQRAIEGVFIAAFGMHIHVWRRADSVFRLVTARRNPNMVILVLSLLAGRPDLGLIVLAAWTAASLLFHLVRLWQALWRRRLGEPVESWLTA